VSVLCDDVIEQTAATGAVGIDAGLDSLLTLSTGEKVTNPRHERADRVRLARAQRELARRPKTPTTGPKPGSRSPASTPGSPTAGATTCTN
jgi:transposase